VGGGRWDVKARRRVGVAFGWRWYMLICERFAFGKVLEVIKALLAPAMNSI